MTTNLFYRVGNGLTVQFYMDLWCDEVPFSSSF